ncbi:MAG: GAF domain-containing protein, partial [Chloroflexi bacterium]|nr:GAF domain-containing protein [Chloroflexota bacterium]
MSLKLLRWIAVVAPLLFLATVDFVRHFLFPNQLHTWVGFLSTYALIGSAIVLFSLLIFGFIARLQQQIVDQNRRLAALNEIAQATAAEPRLDDLLNTSLDHILGSMRAEAGLVCLIDFEREEHSAVCHRGFSPEVVRRIQRAKLKDDPIAQKVVLTGRSVLWERVLEDSQVAEASRREGIRSGISAPLRSEGAVNGILVVATNQQRQFSRAEQDFLGSIGGQLGMAIQNSILYERARRQADELTALLTVGQTVTSSLDLQRTLETALDQSVTVTGAEAGEIWLAEGERLLSLRAHLGAYSEAFLERRSFLWGEGIPGLVAASGETVVVHDLANDPRFLRQAVMRAGFQTFVALPLWRRNKVTGVLAVAARSPEKLTRASDLRLLEGIAEWVAIAVENAGLHRTVQDTAVVE